MEQGIFVSYRRQDSQSAAGRLTDHLKDHLPTVPVFRDVETIEPGVDFVDAIERALQSCAVLIAVIGPRWLDAAHADGRRRLDDPNDYTRLEIATALKRGDVRVIPVLVEGAAMPATADLPDDLEPLARRNAIELSDKRWDFDVSTLAETLRKLLKLPAPAPSGGGAPAPEPPPPATPASRRKWWIGGAIGVVVVLGILGEQDLPTEPGLDPLPAEVTMTPPVGGGAPVTPTVSAGVPDLSGMWRDSDGGMHEIVQHGSDLVFRGRTPDGFVVGAGTISGRRGQTQYTLNGYPLQATFTVSADGQRMDVRVFDPATNAQEVTALVRVGAVP